MSRWKGRAPSLFDKASVMKKIKLETGQNGVAKVWCLLNIQMLWKGVPTIKTLLSRKEVSSSP